MIWSLFALFAAVVLGGLLLVVRYTTDGFNFPCDEP